MGEVDAVGDVVTGGAARRARSSPTPARSAPTATRTRRACLNCGDPAGRRLLPGLRPARPCPPHADAPSSTTCSTACSISKGKIWRTLPMLAWRPGELTRRYIEGERARFVSPMALVPVHGLPDVRGGEPRSAASPIEHDDADAKAALAEELREERAELAERSRRSARALPAAGQPTAAIDERIAERSAGGQPC